MTGKLNDPPPDSQNNVSFGNNYTFPANAAITVTTEHPDQLKARLAQESEEAKDARIRNQSKFFAFLAMFIIVFVTAGIVGFTSTDAALAVWARTLFGSVLSGIAGYVIGKAEKK